MVFYEHLVTQPSELKKICDLFGFILPDKKVVERSSISSTKKSTQERLLFEWKNKLDNEQIKLINNQLEKFGLENLYHMETGFPNAKFVK